MKVKRARFSEVWAALQKAHTPTVRDRFSVALLDINNLPERAEREADQRALRFAMQSSHTKVSV